MILYVVADGSYITAKNQFISYLRMYTNKAKLIYINMIVWKGWGEGRRGTGDFRWVEVMRHQLACDGYDEGGGVVIMYGTEHHQKKH